MLTSQPVFDVECELMWAADSTLVDTLRTVTGDSNNKPASFVMFHIKRPGRYILRMRKDGYETADQLFEVKRFYKDEETVDLMNKPFYMQKERNLKLNEVVVKSKTKKIAEGQPCPLCGQGRIIKGKTAYGCSRWKEGCTYRAPFT